MIAGFAPSYFGATMPGAGTGLIETDQPLSDARALCWIGQTLKDSGLFEWVGLGRVVRPQQNGDYPAAWVYPVSFTESDDVDPVETVRKLTYAVSITVKEDEEIQAIESMDRLSNSVANVLSGEGPEGSLPGLSRVESGRYDVVPMGASPPAIGTAFSGLTLYGSISYFVEGRSGRDEDE